MNPLVKSLLEAGKEGARIILLSVLPVLLAGINTKTGEIAIDWRVVFAVALFTLLKLVDRGLHVYNKEKYPELAGESLGLVRINL